MSNNNKVRVFLSYAHENIDIVRKIDTELTNRNLDVWFDKKCLKPGNWKKQIEKAILKCRFFIICISYAALKKTGDEPGFQGEELQQAYEIARGQDEDFFSIVPVRIEECGRGDHRLSPWHQYDLFGDFETELDRLAIDLGGKPLCANTTISRPEDEIIIRNLFNNAATSYYEGDFFRSLNCYNSIIELNPDNENCAKAWRNKGTILDVLGHKEEAIAAYDNALKQTPSYAEALNNKGTILDELGFKKEAIEAYDKALEIKPDITEAWNNKGVLLAEQGHKQKAIIAFDNAIKINPKLAEAWYNKGLALIEIGRKNEAIIAFDTALKIFKETKSDHANFVRKKITKLMN